MFKKINDFMFDRAGFKIKIIAQVIAWIEIFVSFLVGFAVFVLGLDDLDLNDGLIFVVPLIISLLFIVVGVISAWFSSVVLYGFGELVDNSTRYGACKENKTRNKKNNMEIKIEEDSNVDVIVTCPECGEKLSFCNDASIVSVECPWCGEELKIRTINKNTL